MPSSRVFIANMDNDSVSVIDTATDLAAEVTGITMPLLTAANPNGLYFYVMTYGGEFQRRSVASPATLVDSVSLGSGLSLSMTVAPDGRRAYVVRPNSDIVIVDLDAMSVAGSITTVNIPRFAVADGNGLLYVTSQTPDRLSKVDLSDNSVIGFAPMSGTASGVVLSPDLATAYVGVSPSSIVQVSTSDMTVGTAVTVANVPYSLAITPDGSRLLSTSFSSGAVSIVDRGPWTLVDTIPLGGTTRGVAVTPRGDFAYVTNSDSVVNVLSLGATPAFVMDIAVGPSSDNVGNMHVSPAILRQSDGVMTVDSDASFAAVGFKGFVPIHGGSLQFSGDATIASKLSLLGQLAVAEIDTNGFAVTLAGDSTGDGGATLRKTGAGTLTLAGTHRGSLGEIADGVLLVNGTHPGGILMHDPGTRLGGNGEVGDVTAADGTVAPGAGGQGTGVLTANSLVMTGATRFRIALNSATEGSYGRVATLGPSSIGSATLEVSTGFSPALGTVFIILTNANGTFAGLPEDAIFIADAVSYQISYLGGDGNDVTLTVVNQAPTLTSIQNQTLDEDDAQVVLPFVVGDPDDLATSLVTSATASNMALFPSGSVSVTGMTANRTVALTPAPNQHGAATITVRVADSVQFTETTFTVTVDPVNDAPTIGAIGPQTIAQDASLAPVAFGIADIDVDDPVGALTIALTSSNQALLPNANLVAGGAGASRSVAATPAAGQFGVTIVTVTVSDGEESASTTFTLTVTKAPAGPEPEPEPEPEPPTGLTYMLAEGATGSFFDSDILLANPNMMAVPVTVTFLKSDGTSVVESRELAALSRTTIAADGVAGLEATTFSVVVKTGISLPIAVERTMRWDAAGYGASTEKASMGESATWFFAEGSQGYFSTFLLLANPQETANVAHVTWLREGETPVTRDYPLSAASRTTIDTAADAELQGRSFGASVTFDQPGMAERAMYFGSNPMWLGGHAASGAKAAATTWYLAEGATGSFFTTYVLIANPGAEDADVTLTYYTDAGEQVTITEPLAAGQRMTRNAALDGAALANTAFITKVTATQPVVVERAQYWGAPAWIESHNSVGITHTSRHWALAEGRVGGEDGAQTYILLGNFGTDAATVTLTFLRENNAMPVVKTIDVPAGTRVTVGVTGDPASLVPELTAERFGTLIESTGHIVVERSLYSNANGVIWAAGTNATGTTSQH